MSKFVDIDQFIEELDLEVITKSETIKEITTTELSRVGLPLAGFYGHFVENRVFLMGNSEWDFYNAIPEGEKKAIVETFMQKNIPCMVLTRGLEYDELFIELAKKYDKTLLRTDEKTTRFVVQLINLLEDLLAPTTTIHGVLVDVYGVGVMIQGKSGIGKSETALELVKRGHRFITDDAVEIKKTADGILIGKAPELIKNYLEIRGIGILNIKKLYGIGSVLNQKEIELSVRFKEWDVNDTYDRLGLEDNHEEILGVKVQSVEIPVKPGRNLAMILEAAARNYKQKAEGYNAARELDERLMAQSEGK